MFTKSVFHTVSILAFTFGVGPLAGCGDSGQVNGSAQVDTFGQSSTILAANFVSVDGTYSPNCLNPAMVGAVRGAPGSWSAGFGAATSNIVVAKKDPNCFLSINQLQLNDSAMKKVPAMTMTNLLVGFGHTGYGAAQLFMYTDTGTNQSVSFYASAKITPADFSANFDIDVLYSDTLAPLNTIAVNGTYSHVTSQVVAATSVPAPDDTIGFATVSFMHDASTGVVQGSMGNPAFTAGMNTPGQNYLITKGAACPTTLSAVDAVYTPATKVSTSMRPTSADFGLIDMATTPPTSCMIIANCVATVCSYKLYEVAFN